MKSYLTFSRWLLSILLISFWGIGTVLSQDVGKHPDPNDKAAKSEEMDAFLHQSDWFLDQSTSSRVTGCATSLDEGFEGDIWPPAGWTIINGATATNNMFKTSLYAHDGTYSAVFSSYNNSSDYNQYFISPQLVTTVGDQSLSFWYRQYDWGSEVFKVGWSSTGTDVGTDFTWSSEISNSTTTWQEYVKTDLPVGTKYVAIHYYSTWEYYLFVDDFSGPDFFYPATPYFNGGTYLDYSNTYDEGVYEKTYDIFNCSTTADLDVSLDAADTELAISGLPVTIPAGGSATVTVTFTPSATGSYAYTGAFSMTTNDPDNLLVTVDIYSNVLETVVSPVLFEDFNAVASYARPANWTGDFSVRNTGGVDNGKRFTKNLWSSVATGQFATNFIELPLNSKFKCDYRVVDFTAYPSTPTPAAEVAFTVYISTDYGATFTPIYEYDPLTHVESLDYANVEVDLLTYIGETVMFGVAAEGFNAADFYLDFDNFGVMSAEPGIAFVNANLDMGFRPIGAWMEPARFEIVNNPGAGALAISEADISEAFGGFLAVEKPGLPFNLPSGETTFEFGVKTTEAAVADGAFSGDFAIFFSEASRAVLTATYEGTAYVPIWADVVETADDLGEFGLAPVEPIEIEQPGSRELFGHYKNYILPNDVGNGPLENDYVYKLTFLVDKLFGVTGPHSPNYAIYAEDFGGEPGPMAHNAIYQHIGDFSGVPLFAGTYYLVVSDIMDWESFNLIIDNMPAPDAVTYTYPLDQAVDIDNNDSLTWVFGANTLEYELVLGTTYPPATVVVPYTDELATSFQLDNLNPNLQYFWQVNVKNNNGETPGPVWGFTTTITPPEDLDVSVNDPGVSSTTVSASLEWTGPTNRAFIGYNVYRDYLNITPIPVGDASFTDEDLARNTTYSYYVTTVYDEGESATSDTVEITTQGVGTADGVIYDFLSGDPIEGATVHVQGANGDYSMTTDIDGVYETLAYAGTYDIIVSASGYTAQSVVGVVVSHGATTSNDVYMMESPLPVGDVLAWELSDDAVQISWDGSAPIPIAEWLGYGDGSHTSNWWFGAGVSFTTAINFDPADLAGVDGGSLTKFAIYNLNCTNTNVSTLMIYEGDVAGGTATLLHEQALTDLALAAWNEIDLTTPVPIDVTKQLWIVVNRPSATCGTSASASATSAKADWVYDDVDGWIHMSEFNIFEVWNMRVFATDVVNGRAYTEIVRRPQTPLKSNTKNARLENLVEEGNLGNTVFRPEMNTRAIDDYTVERETVYRPVAPMEIGNTSQQSFVDFGWGTMEWGVYRWAVTVNYEAGQHSVRTYSNPIDKNTNAAVDVTVSLNSNEEPGGTSVTFTNTSEPDLELVYNTSLDNTGFFEWDAFRRGMYDIEVMLPGYAVIQETGVEIFDDVNSFTWLLEEMLAKPNSLNVTPTAFATWQLGAGGGGSFVPVMVDFDSGLPADWTVELGPNAEHADNWTNVTGYGFSNYSIDGTPFMLINADNAGSGVTHGLMTSAVSDASDASSLYVEFDQYLNNYFDDDIGIVEVYDGSNWVSVLEQTTDYGSWAAPDHVILDVTAYANADFRVRFNYESDWGWYWAVDNVGITSVEPTRSRSSLGFKVFIGENGGPGTSLVAETEDREYQFDPNTLVDSTVYDVEVAAIYTTGQSDNAYFKFLYVACENYATPDAFTATQVAGTANVELAWTNVDAAALDTIDAIRLYRDGEEFKQIDFTTEAVSSYIDEGLNFGTYHYCVTYIYASGAETCQGVVCADVDVTGGAFVEGTVTQAPYLGGDPIEGAAVTVTSTGFTATFTTDADGMYSGEVLGNETYDYTVEAVGYVTQTLTAIEILQTQTEVRDFVMMEFPTPVELVVAEEISDNQVKVSWRSPGTNLYEPFLEDFSNGLDNWTVSASNWAINQSANAGGTAPELRFNWSPSGIGDFTITSPAVPLANSNNELYLSFKHMVNDFSGGYTLTVFTEADGVTYVVEEFMPNANIPANTFSTVITDAHGLDAQEFKIGFMFSGDSFDINYWYIDDISLTNTRAANTLREIPESTLAGYNVYRTTCADGGDLQFQGYVLDTIFYDNTWGTAEPGTYKWAVEAVYAENESEARFSNCLDKDMLTTVSVTVTTNSGDSPEGTDVMFTNTSEPDLGLVYETELDETGYFMWEEFRKGVYDIYVNKNGFAPIEISDYLIDSPETFVWLLEELLLPVADLYVTPTGFATWRAGGVIPFADFSENFDEGIPDTWTIIDGGTTTDTWYMETPAGNPQSSGASIDGTPFAFVDSDEAGSGKTLDEMLVSPVIDASSVDALYLHFDQYYNYISGSEFSKVDVFNGSDWVNVLTQTADAGSWTAPNHQTIDVTEYVNDAFQVRFHYFDDGGWKWYWAVDNVSLTEEDPDSREFVNYKIWLDGVWVDDPVETFYQYDVTDLVEGQEYLAEVAAVYSNGMSAKMSYLWTYYNCENYPGPENLAGSVSGQDVTLTWGASAGPPPPPPGDDFFEGFEAGTLPTGWMAYDEDGDGYNWGNTALETGLFEAHTGLYCMTSASYINDVGALNPNNWLVTPGIQATASSELKFWVAGQDPSYAAEQYYVKVSTTGNAVADFTTTLHTAVSTGVWQEIVVDLAAYAGETIYLAFQHADISDMFYIKLDDVTVTNTATRAAYTSPMTAVVGNAIPFKTQGMSQSEIDARIASSNTATNFDPAMAALLVDSKAFSGETTINRAVGVLWGDNWEDPQTSTNGIISTYYGGLNAPTYSADDFTVPAGEEWVVSSLWARGFLSAGVPAPQGFGYTIFANANGAPGAVLYEEINAGANNPDQVEIDLDTPITLAEGTYWVAFYAYYENASGAAEGRWNQYMWNPATTPGNPAMLDDIAGLFGGTGGFVTLTSLGVDFSSLDFAIVGESQDAGGGGGDFETGLLLGTNVYRDGLLIAEMVTDTFYVDPGVDYGMHTYCVTYVYESLAESCSEACVDVMVEEPCIAPVDLVATLSEDQTTAILDWNTFPGTWLSYGDGVYANAIGLTDYPPITVAVQFNPDMLSQYDGKAFSKVNMFYGTGSIGDVTVQIWEGTTLILEEAVTSTIVGESWNEIELNSPVVIDGTKSYKVGYTVSNYNDFPAGAQDFTGNLNSDLVFLNGVWDNLSNYLPYSWLIEAFVSDPVTTNRNHVALISKVISASSTGVPVATVKFDASRGSVGRSTLAFMGYNVYRDGEMINSELVLENHYEDIPSSSPGYYCYTVTAVYSVCGESDPSNQACIDIPVGNIEIGAIEARLYPNPATNNVVIESAQMNRVTVMSALGQVVLDRAIEGEMRHELNTTTYEAGIYLIRIETNEGVVTKRLTIVR